MKTSYWLCFSCCLKNKTHDDEQGGYSHHFISFPPLSRPVVTPLLRTFRPAHEKHIFSKTRNDSWHFETYLDKEGNDIAADEKGGTGSVRVCKNDVGQQTKKSIINNIVECKKCSGRASSHDFFGDERSALSVSRIFQQGTNDETEVYCCEIIQFESARQNRQRVASPVDAIGRQRVHQFLSLNVWEKKARQGRQLLRRQPLSCWVYNQVQGLR